MQVNALRRRRGLSAMRPSAELAAAAREHSTEMAQDGYFDHDSLDGTPAGDRIARYYSFAGHSFWSVGENIAWASPDLGAARTVQMWLASPAHRDNLFAKAWREVGIAFVHVDSGPGLFAALPVTIVTADFGARR